MVDPDGIKNKTLKLRLLTDSLTSYLVTILKQIISSGKTRRLYKKGDKSKLDNYKPIYLTSNISKVSLKIIKDRICNSLDAEQPNEQGKFRREFSTIDYIFAYESSNRENYRV